MKYLCLGYMEEKKWEAMSESERDAMIKECFAYDDVLRKNGHYDWRGSACKAFGTPPLCDGRAARSPLLTGRLPKQRNSWAEFCCWRRMT